jgi:hypothetical protein
LRVARLRGALLTRCTSFCGLGFAGLFVLLSLVGLSLVRFEQRKRGAKGGLQDAGGLYKRRAVVGLCPYGGGDQEPDAASDGQPNPPGAPGAR